MHRRFVSVLWVCLLVIVLASSLFQPQAPAFAAPTLTIKPITWNIIGLDSNTPATGPYLFPVGARVCSGGATNVTVRFNWDDGLNAYTGDPYINLRSSPSNSASSMTLAFTAAGCQDAYFEVQVSQVAGAYDKSRRYYITAENAGGADLVSTPRPRELYVEHLISQNRNSVTDVKLNGVSIPAGGTMTLMVGNTYTIDLVGGTATQGYNQFESFINFPNTIFQIISKTANTEDGVLTDYAANNAPSVNSGAQPAVDYRGLYADACVWENNPSSPNYRSCVGGDYKTGGAPVTTTYTIKVIGGAGTTQKLNSLLYDFSGSSFHYNSDAGTGVRFAQIIGPSSVTIQKAFSPKALAPAGTSTMTIKLSNPTTENLTGLHFTDTFPISPAAMTVASPFTWINGCGGTLLDNLGGALGAGDAGIQLVNGTLSANTTCTITVNLTVPSNGSYTNTTGNLFINLGGTDTDTGNNASDTLTAATAAACTPNQTLVTWTVPVGATNPPDTATGGAGSPTTNNTGFAATASAQTPARTSIANIGTNDAASWLLYGLQTGNYVQFVVDTRYYSGVTMTFQMKNNSVANGPTAAAVSYNAGAGFIGLPAATLPIPADTNWASEAINFSGLTSTTGTTTFRIAASGAKNDNSGAGLNFDVVSFTGCALPTPAPTIAKTFRNAAGTADVTSIQKDATSVLRFTISNTAVGNRALSAITFTDTLPLGLDVVSPTSSQCGGTLTVTNNTSPTRDTISLSGGSLAAGGSCTFDVTVTGTTAGQYDNVTGYVSSTQTGTTTSYAQDTLNVIAPPVLAKAFNLSTILTGGTSTLSFTITNPNNFTSLSGISFTDTLPAGVTAGNGTMNNVCGAGSSLVISGTNLLTFSGGSLAAHGSCTFPVPVTGTTAGTKNNTTSAVTSTEGGNGSTASASLVVNNPVTLIGLNKQVSTDNTTWLKYVGVIPTQNIWYKFTITNDGEATLNGLDLSDSGYNLASCSPALPTSLAVGASASCVLGPISVTTAPTPNPFINTATVTTTTYTPPTPVTSSARYGTESLAIVKNVNETYFTAEGNTLHYNYTVTNNGGYPLLAPVTVSDDKLVSVSCQDVTTVGDNDSYLDPGESVYCPGPAATDTVAYSVTATDVSNRLVTNTAHASADGVTSPAVSKTVPLAPDLSVSKTNSITGDTTTGTIVLGSGTFDWNLIVSNSAIAGPASFTAGQTILTDTLPVTGATYAPGTITYTNTTGTVNCSIDGTTFVLTCTANSSVTMPSGASFTVPIMVTPSAVGSLVNPKTAGGSCQVDPNPGVLVEIDENNNNCNSNTVTVLAAPKLTLQKTVVNDNGGTALDTAWTLTATQGGTTISGVEGDAAITNASVAAGTWILSESSGPMGYTPGTWSCSGTSDNDPNDGLSLVAAETVTCTITNNDNPPSLTLVKTVTNDNGGVATASDWTLTATGASATPTNLSGATPVTSGPSFKADTYTLGETGVPAGYIGTWSCTNGVTVTTDQITLTPGQATTCTIHNDDQPATLTLQKTVVNDNGGTAVDTDWTLQAAGPVTISGTEGSGAVTNASVSAGTYTLSESGVPSGYTQGIWSCTNGVTVTGGQITVALGQTTTCTITNDDNAPSLTLQKTVTNNNGGTAVATDWTLTATGASGAPTNLSGTTPVTSGAGFQADTYSLAEVGPSGYTASAWSCTNGVTVTAGQITLGLGQATTCTITNDDMAPSLTLVKNVTNDNGGTATVTDWTLTATGSSGTPTNLSGTTPVTSGVGFKADTYTLDEINGPAGYTPGNWSCTNGVTITGGKITLGPGQATTCTIVNDDTPVPALTIVKSETSTGPYSSGDTITYNVVVTNTGNTTLTNVVVSDPKLTPNSTTCASLAPLAKCTLTGSYLVQQADVDAGSFTNTGSVTDNDVCPAAGVATCEDMVTVNFPQNPALTIVKSETSIGPYIVGNSITYEVVVTNTGNVTLTNVVVSDPKLAPNSNTCASLPPLTTCILKGTHTVQQTDIDAGSFSNTGSVTDDEVCPAAGPTTCEDTVTVNFPRNPALTIAKSETSTGPYAVNSVIAYDVVVTNTGNTTLTNVVVSDPQLTPNSNTCATLAPKNTCTLTGTYTVQQADVDAGNFTNTGSVTDNDVCPAAGPATCQDTVTVNFPRNPQLTIVKSETSTGPYAVNDIITYDVVVTNTGNVTLTNVVVSDLKLTPSSSTCATVAPLGTCILTGTYTVNQADVDAGSFANTGSVTDNDVCPAAGTATCEDTVTVNFPQNSALTIVKSETSTGPYTVNDVITYDVVVTNIGNITLQNVVVSDAALTPSSVTCASLAPASQCTLTGTYTVTVADVTSGSFTNTGSVTDSSVCPAAGPATCEDTVTVNFPQNPAIQVVKSSTTNSITAAAQVVPYTFTVRNVGNITLTGITVDDLNCDAAPAYQSGDTNGNTSLELTEMWNYTCSHTVTQAEVDAGGNLSNTVTADSTESAPDTDVHDIPVTQAPALTIAKSETSTGPYTAGASINYDVVVTNTGNTTLTNVVVSDPKLTPNSNTCATLAPTSTCTLSGSYTVQQADIDAGIFTNTGSVTDNNVCPAAGTATCEDTATVNFPKNPALTVVKSETSTGPYAVGDTITYNVLVTNTGNVTLTGVGVTDAKADLNACTPVQPSILAPKASMSCPASHLVSQADINAGSFVNTATADSNETPPSSSTVTVNFTQAPSLNVVKEVSTDGNTWNDTSVTVNVGDTVYYRVRVENTGNITLTGLTVDDGMTSCTLVRGTDITGNNNNVFEPQEEWAYSCTVTAVAGTNNNTATADTNETQQDTDSASYTSNSVQIADPALSKSANPLLASAGDTVTFTLTVTNQGTVPATGVVITDALPSIFDVTAVHVTGAPGAPGSTLVNVTPAIGTGTAPYTVVVTLGADLSLTDVVTIQIVTRVNAQGSSLTTNRARLTTTGSNQLLTNDSASVGITVRQPRTPRTPRTTTSFLAPVTGFARGVTTLLETQPSDLKYSSTDLVLEIPSLSVKLPIVGVPKQDGTWNVSWLADDAGWLEGTAFPSWSGNSVLTGHVYLASGLPGPFVNLQNMKYGDKIIVHAYGQKYTFEVQSNQVVKPDDASVIKHEEKPWLTLVTCKDYDEKTKTYQNRVVVRAALVRVEWDK